MIRIPKSLTVSLVTTLVLGGVPHAPSAAAQSQAACDAAIEKLERETQQLGRDLNADVREAVRTDVAETSLAGVRNHFKAKPASEAVFDLKDKWDNFNTYAERIKSARVTMDDLVRCINTRGCSLIEFAKRQNEAIAKWIQSLGDDGLTAATERVNRAGSLLRNYAERTLNTGIGGAMDTVGKCNARFEQQATSNISQPGTQNAPPPTGGGSVGKIVGWTALMGGAIAAGAYAASQVEPVDLGTITGSSNTTTTTNNSGLNGAYTASVTRSCQTGSVNSNPLSPSFIEPCNSAVAQGSCSSTNFTITVSNGVARDCGGWLANGSLTSSGAYSALYVGVCGSGGVTVSGNLSSSLQGTGTCRGNTYTVAIALRKQ